MIDHVQTIQALLMAVEAEGEAMGWDSTAALPHLFEVRKGLDGSMRVEWPRALQELLDKVLETTDGNCGDALQIIALACEMGNNTPAAKAAGLRVGEGLIALGMRSETWMLEVPGPEDEAGMQAARAHRINEHPDRIEGRMVWCFDREGHQWVITRRRGSNAEISSDGPVTGAVPNGITRIMNEIIEGGVPIVSIDEPTSRQQ